MLCFDAIFRFLDPKLININFGSFSMYGSKVISVSKSQESIMVDSGRNRWKMGQISNRDIRTTTRSWGIKFCMVVCMIERNNCAKIQQNLRWWVRYCRLSPVPYGLLTHE